MGLPFFASIDSVADLNKGRTVEQTLLDLVSECSIPPCNKETCHLSMFREMPEDLSNYFITALPQDYIDKMLQNHYLCYYSKLFHEMGLDS